MTLTGRSRRETKSSASALKSDFSRVVIEEDKKGDQEGAVGLGSEGGGVGFKAFAGGIAGHKNGSTMEDCGGREGVGRRGGFRNGRESCGGPAKGEKGGKECGNIQAHELKSNEGENAKSDFGE